MCLRCNVSEVLGNVSEGGCVSLFRSSRACKVYVRCM